MKKWTTQIRAICPITNELRTFEGPLITAPTAKLAQDFCQQNGFGYCKVGDECVAVLNNKTSEYTDFNIQQNN